jgi:hypothetical protein
MAWLVPSRLVAYLIDSVHVSVQPGMLSQASDPLHCKCVSVWFFYVKYITKKYDKSYK